MKKKKKKVQTQKNKERKKNKRKLIIKSRSKVIQKQPKLSFSALKKSIIHIPKLIFEPEIEAISFNAETIKSNREKHDKLMDEYLAYFETETEVLDKVKEALFLLNKKFEGTKEKTKLINVQTLSRIINMDDNKYMNQLLISKYIKHRYEVLGEGDEITPENAVDVFEKISTEFFPDDSAHEIPLYDDDNIDDEPVEDSIFGQRIDTFTEVVLVGQNYTEEESIIVDIEAFFIDYIMDEKEFSTFEEITIQDFKTFLREWVVDTLKPSQEEMKEMLSSLKLFLNYMLTEHSGDNFNAQEYIDHIDQRGEMYLSLLQ